MEWSNEVIMEFLDLYEGEPVIWDPLHEHHKDRSFCYDAWKRIESNLSTECPITELKRKKEILMATYRKLALKVMAGAATNRSYTPEWFAYDKMASFLHKVYTPRGKMSTEKSEKIQDIYEDEELFSIADPVVSSGEDEASEDSALNRTLALAVNSGAPKGKKRKSEKRGKVDKQLTNACLYLKKIASKPKVAKDDVSLFCELLSLKLRALDDEPREIAMHEINNLMFFIKNSPNTPFHHSYQQPGYFQSYFQQGHDSNQHLSPAYENGESSTSYLTAAPTLSTLSTPRSLNDTQSEEKYNPDV